MAKLTWTDSTGANEFPLKSGTTIGRSPGNDLQLSGARTSGHHARIVDNAGRWAVEDCGSTNGTYVNGERVSRRDLKPGDIIGIGTTQIAFHESDAAGAPKEPRRGSSTTSKGISSFDTVTVVSAMPGHANAAPPRTTAINAAPVLGTGREDPEVLTRRFRASYEIAQAAAATLDIPELMNRALGALFGIFDRAERAFILLVDPQSGEVRTSAVRRRTPSDREEITLSHTALKQAMDRQEAILCVDALQDTRYAAARSVVALGIRSMMIAPLLFQSEALGAIYVDTRAGVGGFTQPDLELLTVAAGQMAACVANAQLHEKMVASERLAAVGQTVAGLTHCIKNILQGINGGVFIVDRALEKNDLERLTFGWEMLKRNQSFMEDLVFDLLSFSKQRRPQREETDLNGLCEDVCALARARADEKGVAFSFEPDPDLRPIQVDPMGIRRSVLNLAMNAVDASAESKASVTVSTHAPTDGEARIAIADTGCGMSEGTQAKLFTVFFSTKGAKGTGLGLAVTKKVIEEHGGDIDVASKEGEGTTFTIRLPVVPPTTPPTDAAANP